ncbi:hypothetical protein QN277_009319 [Acacia crassicarpa]|uniref:Uncharacterized protein n=1 Tax=Acacia crassicarpa TaxID=499986 RepID=A0AAE1IRY8_9FABA|nr:hypothetical protein QN277_009319 [Acacia crassicarpa]
MILSVSLRKIISKILNSQITEVSGEKLKQYLIRNEARISLEEPQMLMSGNSNKPIEAFGNLMLRSNGGCVFEMLRDVIIFEHVLSPSC